jgi:hypothetical protein
MYVRKSSKKRKYLIVKLLGTSSSDGSLYVFRCRCSGCINRWDVLIKLSMNDELTSVVRLFEIADRCAKAEEGRLFMHNLPEALPQSRSPRTPSERRLLSLRQNQIISNTAGTASNAIKVDVVATAFSTRRTPTIPTIVGLSESFMKKMVSPSTAGVAVATARVDPGAIAVTTTARRVAAVRVCLEPILSHCHCPHQ